MTCARSALDEAVAATRHILIAFIVVKGGEGKRTARATTAAAEEWASSPEGSGRGRQEAP